MRKLMLFLQGLAILALSFTALGFNLTNPEPLPLDEAFQFSAQANKHETITAQWKITRGYFLYKEKIGFSIISPRGARLGAIDMPSGLERSNPIIGYFQAYSGTVNIKLPIEQLTGNRVTLLVHYQGCSEDNFCYPPTERSVTLDMTKLNTWLPGTPYEAVSQSTSQEREDNASRLLAGHSLVLILLGFFGFGLLLSFTPCVLPMIPILSGIILGHGKHITHKKAFFLSLTYVLSMSITYAFAGLLTAYLGASLQVFFQNPWIISFFALLFVVLALSLFGLYELKLPQGFEDKVTTLSNKQQSGHFWGVAVMGVLSTLIVSPCVTAPLVGALAYISKTGDTLLGTLALFFLGLGMGLPLIIIGTFGAKLLPKAGSWMTRVKIFFGLLFLGLSIWMLSRILPGNIILFLWASLFIVTAVFMGLLRTSHENALSRLSQGFALLFAIYGVILLIGASQGHESILHPLKTHEEPQALFFAPIANKEDLQNALSNAQGKITVLDFYADWCASCKELEHHTFENPTVQTKLSSFNLLKANITDNNKEDKALMKSLNVIAPPTLIFFDSEGNEIPNSRIIGYLPPDKFLEHLNAIMNNTAENPQH